MAWLLKLLERWGGSYFFLAASKRAAEAGDALALQTLAQDALQHEDLEEAGRLIERALATEPNNASLWVTKAAILRRREDFPAARAALEQALLLAPGNARALTNLAEIDLLHGDAAAALEKLEAALAVEPHLMPALVNRIAALSEVGRHEEARAAGERLLKRNPANPELLLNTANALLQLGHNRRAVELLHAALRHKPDFPEAKYLLAALVGDMYALEPALQYLEKRLAREGESLSLLNTLASGHLAAGNLARAHALAQRILSREPGHLNALMVLAGCSSSSGHAEIADRLYGDLCRRAGDRSALASTWLFEGNYLPRLSPVELFARHREWAQHQENSQAATICSPRRHNGPLRVGYVSGDLCRHPVGYLLLQIILLHDHSVCRPVAFSTTLREDDMTRALKDAFHAWHDVYDLEDDALLELVRKEEIDILVDLSGHTAHHRLNIFARRAAPVQVTWIGYFHSTGLTNIDYLLTDPHTSPPHCAQHFSEVPIYLGNTRFCFFPPVYAPPVAPAPAAAGRPFTFGCFNRLDKINEEVIEVWSEILRRAPHTRLWLKASALKDAWVRADLTERFRAKGVTAERLVLSGGSSHNDMLREFAMVDLCLDPFPFTGGATSLESFWMGVPTLTLPGATLVSRQTHAMNVNLGIDERFSATSARDYIERAVAFSLNNQPLIELRPVLRERMVKSPLCDGKTFTRRLERFYRSAHEAALKGRKLPAYFTIE
ncbi:MAG: tetratricopeptide repeat protein [Rhodocyclaceae bacterium]|nr:tetratricopeptide repeat protein [Rhodocyclaceae bacterium]